MERNDNVATPEDWCLTADGLEHAATGYFIEREVIGARRADGLWEWPLQLAEKAWCRPAPFAAAFRAALDRFAIAPDEALDLSLAMAFPSPAVTLPGGFRPLAEVVSTPATRAGLRRAVGKGRAVGRPGVPVTVGSVRPGRRLAEIGA